MPYYTYILQCADKKLYTGTTDNLKFRLKTHNLGRGPKFTQKRLPVKLVYFEKFATLKEARQRERQIKGWRQEKKINLIKYGHPARKKITSNH